MIIDNICSGMSCKNKPYYMVWFLDVGSGYCKNCAKKYIGSNDFKVEKIERY